jgi:predicted Zn-dependent protease with MMP-like domain
MRKLNRPDFERIVEEGMSAIPEKFLQKLDNVALVIENEPTADQKKKLKIRRGWTLFGLYEGVPQSKRGASYGAVLPDKITIFQRSIEREASNINELMEIVKHTIWHEIAHHFGMGEMEVRQSEIKRRERSNKLNQK